MTRVSFEHNSYDVSIDEKTNNISQIKIRQNNSTIFNLVKYLAIFTLSLFILDFFLDLGENVASIFSSGSSSSSISIPTTTMETVQTGGSSSISFIRSLGKYILALLCIVLYFYSFEWATLSDEEFKKLSTNKLFVDLVKSTEKPKETKSVETPKSTSESKDTISANTTTNTTTNATIPVASVPTTPSVASNTVTTSPTNTVSTQQSTLPSATVSPSAEPAPASTTNAKLQSSSVEGKKETFEDYALDGYAPYNSNVEYASY